jgi:hypothetical protein
MTPNEALASLVSSSAAGDRAGSCQQKFLAAGAPCMPHGSRCPRHLFDRLRHSLYTWRVPPGGHRSAVVTERFIVCNRYPSMESLANSAPLCRWGRSEPGVVRRLAPVAIARARAGTPGPIIIGRDLELERVIGCAEANVSAQTNQAHPQVWLPGPHGRSRRSRRAGPATAQGTPCAHRRRREQVHAESLGDSPPRGDRSGTPAGGR